MTVSGRIYPRGIIPLVALALLSGCAYEKIGILAGRQGYDGETLTDYRDVEVRSSGIVLKPGARFAIRSPDLTQFIGRFDVAILSGDGLRVYMRTVPHLLDSTKGIALLYSSLNGCSVRTADGGVIPVANPAGRGAERLTFHNEAGLLSISIGCREIYEDYVDLPSTEYVIFEALPGSTVELRTVRFSDIYTE
ncbi:MAG: hypothetical protein JWQ98_2969 [Chlorobi bacterium]|nr:hypothetical protein [Chlorobiota bacterium]